MSIAALVRNMADAGASPEAIAIAVEAVESALASADAPRAAARERKRRQRERDAGVTVTGQDVTSCDRSPPLPLSPQTPLTPTPPPGDILPARKGLSRVDVARGFAAFWAAYPKRVGKDAAAKAFAKAMSRITEDDPLSVILAGIERALPGWEDAQFIPHPTTWLNQGRWEDEAPQSRIERPRNDRPDRFTAKQSNYDAALVGSQWADQVLADRRTF